MTQVSFYHLTRFGLDEALPPLLEKVLSVGGRALVVGKDDKKLQDLDKHLWTYRAVSFLPHGLESEDFKEQQPILLSSAGINANGANYLFLIDGAEMADVSAYENVIIIFNGRDDDALALARGQYTLYKSMQCNLRYFQQTEKGGWENK